MADQDYINKLVGGIGRVTLSTNVSNSFPMVGETVTLESVTKWAQKMYFTKMSEVGVSSEEIIDNTSQKTSVTIPVNSTGDLIQEVRAVNYRGGDELFSASMLRCLYAMQPQVLPYHEVAVSDEIIRTDQSFTLRLSGENGYDLSREHTLEVFVLKENGNADNASDVVAHRTQADFTLLDGILVSDVINIPQRGIYDVETRYYDAGTQKTIGKRINKLLTVTPRLAAVPADGQKPFGTIENGTKDVNVRMYKTGVNDLYMEFDIPDLSYYPEINMSDVPEGYDAYTLVLKKPLKEDDNVISRVRLKCNIITGNPQQTPTPQFTSGHPLVVTINQPTPLDLHGVSYNTLNVSGIRNMVIDGRGYYNLSKGIKFSSNPVTNEKPTIPVQFSGGASDMELFELEISGCGFAGIMAKTDPDGTNPWWWYGNFEQKNTCLHHLHVHDTDGEGCYLGYYTSGMSDAKYTGDTVTFENLNGEMVTYVKGNTYKKKAHYLTGLRFYRNLFEHTSYDGVQISDTIGEVCYNTLRECAVREEASQTSGLSIQSFSGKCYNNFLLDNHGPNLQVGPIGDIELFNNVVQSKHGVGVQFLFDYSSPEQNPSGAAEGSGVVNEKIQIVFHNNVLSTPGMTANGRNTVQVRGVHMVDNLIANDGNLFANMTSGTIAAWTEQAVGNMIIPYSELYSKSIEFKIADYVGGDYRVSNDSPLVSAGLGNHFLFDYRGYYNWFKSIFPIGAFMGKYLDSSVIDSAIRLKAITAVLETSIPNTVSILFDYVGMPVQYRLGESEDLSGTEWLEMTEEVVYTFASAGDKTLYARMKNADGELSEVRSTSIKIPDANGKIAISIGWVTSELDGKKSLFDPEYSLTKIAITIAGNTGTIYSPLGEAIGTFTKIDSKGASYMSETTKGVSTGNNSGIYLDSVIEHNICSGGNGNTDAYRENKIVIPPGTYKIRIFCSTITSSVATSRSAWKLSVGGVVTEFVPPEGFTPYNNLNDWLEQTIDVGEDGFSIIWGVKSSGAYIQVPLNIIEIEKI